MAKHDFPRIEQIESNMCGPACVEMMLAYLGVTGLKSTSSPLQQEISLFEGDFVAHTEALTKLTDKQDPWSSFVTRPIEMVNMFQTIAKKVSDKEKKELLSKLGMNYFSRNAVDGSGFSLDSKVREFLAHLAARIQEVSHPPLIIPIHEASHWVVLYDVTVKNSKNKKEARWTFKGKDPIQYSTKKQNNSATAGIITISDSYWNFDNPVNLVCIEKMPDDQNTLNLTSRGIAQFLSIPVLPMRMPGTPVSPATILNLVKQEIGGNELNANVRSAPVLKIGIPMLIRRIDRPNYDYYLVPIMNEKGETTQLIRMDALTGEFLDSLQIDPTALIFDINEGNSETQSRRRVNTLRPTDLPNIGQSQLEAQATVTTNLVWKPSEQSMSAFFPLHQIQPEMFRRIDGETFTGPLTAPIKTGKQVSHM